MRQNLIGTLNGDIQPFFTTFSSSRAGVTILFDNNFQFQILKHFAHPRREVYYYRQILWTKL